MAQRLHVMICTCTNCISNGALTIKNALESEIGKKELSEDVQVVQTGASGLCVKGPILMVQPDGIFYQYLKEKDIPNLVEEHFLKGRPVKSLMYVPAGEEIPIPKITDIPFFKDQRLIALKNRGLIDPDSIDEYIANDGYKALAKVLSGMGTTDLRGGFGTYTLYTDSPVEREKPKGDIQFVKGGRQWQPRDLPGGGGHATSDARPVIGPRGAG